MELEDNSREIESLFRQQKYLESYKFESIFDEFLFKINLYDSAGISLNLNNYLQIVYKKPLSFKYILFFKTNYLKYYRSLMIDLGLEFLMF